MDHLRWPSQPLTHYCEISIGRDDYVVVRLRPFQMLLSSDRCRPTSRTCVIPANSERRRGAKRGERFRREAASPKIRFAASLSSILVHGRKIRLLEVGMFVEDLFL